VSNHKPSNFANLIIPIFVLAVCLSGLWLFALIMGTQDARLQMEAARASDPRNYATPTPTPAVVAMDGLRMGETGGGGYTAAKAAFPSSSQAPVPVSEGRRLLSAALDLYSGTAGRIDVETAAQLLKEAAAMGEPLAEACLAVYRKLGREGFRDYDGSAILSRRSMEAVNEAALTGDPEAAYILGLVLDGRLDPSWKSPSSSIEWLERSAGRDYAPAMRELAMRYEKGDGGVEQSESKALQWFHKAAQLGDARALGGLATRAENARDYERALQWRQDAVQRGDASSINALGLYYFHGWGGLERDDKRAAELFREAMEKDIPSAAGNLGWMMAEGRGVPRDERQGMELITLAARAGDPVAMARLARLNETDRGAPANDAQATLWHGKAAETGDPEAINGFAWFLERSGDNFKAFAWYKRASEAGHPLGTFNMARMIDQGRGARRDEDSAKKLYQKAVALGCDPAQALAVYREAADEGSREAMYDLAWVFQKGRGVVPDPAAALEWYRKAAERGHVPSMARAGAMMLSGRGVERDFAEARKLLQRGADAGDADSLYFLGVTYEKGWGVKADRYEAVQLYRRAMEGGSDLAGDAYSRLTLGG
jgi:TPR repeat protein